MRLLTLVCERCRVSEWQEPFQWGFTCTYTLSNTSNLLSPHLQFPDIQLIGLAGLRKLNFFINFQWGCLFSRMQMWSRRGGASIEENLRMRGRVKFIRAWKHLFIKSGIRRWREGGLEPDKVNKNKLSGKDVTCDSKDWRWSHPLAVFFLFSFLLMW